MKLFRIAVIATFALTLSLSAFAADGAAIYKGKCAMCHGANGEGKPAMKTSDLGAAATQSKTDAQLTEITAKGAGKMPAYEGKLSKEEIDAVVKFVRTLKK
jgi:cytochrome c6